MKNTTRRSPTSRRRRTSSGAVFLESAVIYLLFIVILLGTFDFGQFLFVHQALVERARYAARWGAINDPTNSASITNMVLYNQSADPASGTPTYMNLVTSNVTVTNPGSGTDNYYLNVQISGYSFTALSPYLTGTLTGPPVTVSVPLGMYN
jgi:Flp pilus assembly protein TadG